MTGEIDDLQLQVDSSNQLAISLEKKSRNFDKIVSEWKAKVEDLTQQLEEAQKEKRYNMYIIQYFFSMDRLRSFFLNLIAIISYTLHIPNLEIKGPYFFNYLVSIRVY